MRATAFFLILASLAVALPLETTGLDSTLSQTAPKNVHVECDMRNPQCKSLNDNGFHTVNEFEGHLGRQAGVGGDTTANILEIEGQKDLSSTARTKSHQIKGDLQGRSNEEMNDGRHPTKPNLEIEAGLGYDKGHRRDDPGRPSSVKPDEYSYNEQTDPGLEGRNEDDMMEQKGRGREPRLDRREHSRPKHHSDGDHLVDALNVGRPGHSTHGTGSGGHDGHDGHTSHRGQTHKEHINLSEMEKHRGRSMHPEDHIEVVHGDIKAEILGDVYLKAHPHGVLPRHSATNKALESGAEEIYPADKFKVVGNGIKQQTHVVQAGGDGVAAVGKEADRQFGTFSQGCKYHCQEGVDAVVE